MTLAENGTAHNPRAVHLPTFASNTLRPNQELEADSRSLFQHNRHIPALKRTGRKPPIYANRAPNVMCPLSRKSFAAHR